MRFFPALRSQIQQPLQNPFARAIMSDTTRDGGFLPLNLNPIDFVALYQNNISDPEEKHKKEPNSSAE